MARSEDSFDDNENGHGHDGATSSHSRNRFGNTSSFDTTLISDDGRFLGMSLSPEMASDLRKFYAVGLDWARRKGEQIGGPLAEKIAKSAWGANSHQAKNFAQKVVDYVGYSIILSNQALDVGRNIHDSVKSLNELHRAVHPLAHASKSENVSALGGNNEVVANARAKINGIFWQRLLETATGAIATAPALFSKMSEQTAKNRDRKKQQELENIKNDPKALAAYWEKEAGVEHIVNAPRNDMQTALDISVEGQRKRYIDKFTEFKAANAELVAKELGEALKLTPDDVHYKLKTLREHGIDTYRLQSAISDESDPKVIAEAIQKFERGIQGQMKHLTDNALKAQFVLKHGAFDDEWAHYYHHGEGRYGKNRQTPPTIKDKIEQKFTKIEEDKRSAEQGATDSTHGGHDGKTTDMGKMAAGLGAGLVAEFTTKTFGGKALDQYAQPIALDRILHLRRILEQAKEDAPEQVPGISLAKGNEKDMGYVQYVHQIFQQHQKDCKRTEIGDRFVDHFESSDWDDASIQKLPDSELTPYEYAIKSIAKRIEDGRMDAIALVELVGDRQKKIVQNDGRTFGPQGTNKDDKTIKEAILHIVDEKTALLHAGQAQSETQINDKLGNFVFSVDDLKRALESDSLDQHQRAFIFTVFSDVVGSDEKLCQKIGISNERCQSLRKECKESFTVMLDGAVTVLAEMIQNEPEILEKHLKLTDKEKQLIISLSERVREETKDVADVTTNREELRSLETVVANAAMTLGKEPAGDNEKSPGFWQRLMSAAQKPKEVTASKRVGGGLDDVPLAPDNDFSGRPGVSSKLESEIKRRATRANDPQEGVSV